MKDIEANIEDEKDNMSEDNYEDTVDVLGMLDGNLQKVGEHGVNTTRTLKAMEEMLKDRTGGVVEMDLSSVFKQDEEMVGKYYAEDIAQYHITTKFNYQESGVMVKGNHRKCHLCHRKESTTQTLRGCLITGCNGCRRDGQHRDPR